MGRYCSIAGNVNIGYAGHSTSFLSSSTFFKFNKHARDYLFDFIDSRNLEWEQEMARKNLETWKKPLPIIENDVWIGGGCHILNGVTIGNGAVVAAGSVVTKNVEPFCIVGGVPARIIRRRFNDKLCERIEASKWWEYSPKIIFGLDISNPSACIDELEKRIEKAEKFQQPHIEFDIENSVIKTVN